MNGNNLPDRENSGGNVVKKEITVSSSFSGPLPPPEILDRYNKIVAGAAERIIKMAEQQSQHRRDLESRVINSDIKNSKLGLIFGFFIALGGLLLAGFVTYLGKSTLGGIFGFATLASLVGVFVYGSKSRREERAERRKQ